MDAGGKDRGREDVREKVEGKKREGVKSVSKSHRVSEKSRQSDNQVNAVSVCPNTRN